MDKGLTRQFVAAFIGSLSVMAAGCSYGWVTPLLSQFHSPDSPIPLTHVESSWAVALIEFGNLFTSIPAGLLVNRWGRKSLLLATAPVYVMSWLCIVTIKSVTSLYIARTIQGLAMGVIYTVLPVYLAEIGSQDVRGALTTFFEAMWYTGILMEYILGPHLSFTSFTLVTCSVPIVFFVTFICIPDSPYYYLMQGDQVKAADSLIWLRATADIEEELYSMKKTIEEEREQNRSWKNSVVTRANVKALMIVEIVVLTKFMSGIAAVLSYSSDMFASTGSTFTADNSTIIMGVLLLLTTIFAGALVDKVGRRPLLLISCFGCCITEFISGLFCFLHTNFAMDLSPYSWVFMTSVMIYCVIFSLGLGPLTNTLKGELFPSFTKGFGSGLTTMTDTISCFVCLKMYQVVTDSYGIYLNFWIFSSFSLMGFMLIYLLVPETKGKTFIEIQQMLNDSKDVSVNTTLQYDFEAETQQCSTEEEA
ncbi:facilitated trehalose transporter Tret1-like [Macrosteles quadrilineatus]|uniref:facilitated trehalose transporter Tret1-like n=1 Tax=Macrosteles quadrilineatus TaxID=74068 RepID=UPI0023E0A0D8|nr:facilitated trehalose transporter Tret1-like [Macrosteles quadrilineatus]